MASADARERIIVAAERLIAERGTDVPLRDIAIAAGQRNNSAVQYHFGSRDGLINAVAEYRMADLEQHRLERLADDETAGAPHSVRALVSALVLPMLTVPYENGATHYARFLERIRTHAALSAFANLDRTQRASVRLIITRLDRTLQDLPTALRRRRLRTLPTVLFALLADRERAVQTGGLAPDDPDSATELVDLLTGMLTAPVSATTGAAP
ncbi:TetR family transcriptional regulator [Saccharopolyspora sp. K220]|uniref:TetR/AcrR family transcriptional regulator n=1 Tax=Saccharopolyspora soli TaxID=2926618 RepID=UPI001F5736A1|nr:TetR/AcrR family transcriptional regulator [Saccharopolyspora soli]MCI2416417.1 TetR family transcriptional regulator [Saccharopolyspora soli]